MRPCEIRFWTVLLLIAAVLYLGSIATAAFGAVEPVKPEVRQARPQIRVDRQSGTVPCLRPPERPRSAWLVLVGPNGEMLIIGAHQVRQRC
jgi:hypothetical protein